jgi:hypothetical protein
MMKQTTIDAIEIAAIVVALAVLAWKLKLI